MTNPSHCLRHEQPRATQALWRRRPHRLAHHQAQCGTQRARRRVAQQEAQSACGQAADVRRGVRAQARSRAQRGQRIGRQQLDQVLADEAKTGEEVLQQLGLALGACSAGAAGTGRAECGGRWGAAGALQVHWIFV